VGKKEKKKKMERSRNTICEGEESGGYRKLSPLMLHDQEPFCWGEEKKRNGAHQAHLGNW